MEMASAEVGAVLCTDKCVDKERWTEVHCLRFAAATVMEG